MAIESVAITAGSGTKIAVDTVDTDKNVQYTKLMDGTDGSAVPIPGDTDNGLDVDPTRLPVDGDGALGPVKLLIYDDSDSPGYVEPHLDYGALKVKLTNAGDVAVRGVQGQAEGTAPSSEPVFIAARAYTTVPGAVDSGDLISPTTDLYGRLRVLPGANSGVDIGDVDVTSMPTGASATAVQGTVAAGSAAAQNPVLNGAKAVSTLPAVVDANDVANLLADLMGRLITLPYAPAADTISGCSVAITDTTATNVIATDSGAGLKWYVTSIMVTNSHATVGTLVTVQDDEGSPTVLWQGYAAPAGGGWSITFPVPIPTAANAHIHALNGTTGSSTYVCVSCYKAP
jgi:hypothetical protein